MISHSFLGNCVAIDRQARAAASYSNGPSVTAAVPSANNSSAMTPTTAPAGIERKRSGAMLISRAIAYASPTHTTATSTIGAIFHDTSSAVLKAYKVRRQED